MSDYDLTFIPVKHASMDVGRKLKFWDDPAGATAAVVKDQDGNILTQPVKVPGSGTLTLRFDQWPVYYSDNRSWRTIRMVPGAPPAGKGMVMSVYDVTATTAEVNAGTKVIVAGEANKAFVPMDAFMQAIGGDAAGATLVRLVEETSGNVIMSHAVADMTEDTWVAKTGGTVVTTYLARPMAADRDILIDKTGDALATATHVRVIVVGFFIDIA